MTKLNASGPVNTRESPCSSAALHAISAGSRAMDLNACRQDIERAAAKKVSSRGGSLTVRQCLLEVGFPSSQASNRTMQARVRREVQRLTQGRPKAPGRTLFGGEGRIPVPYEISIPASADISFGMEEFENDLGISEDVFGTNDDVSVLTDASYFQRNPGPSQLSQLHSLDCTTSRPMTESPKSAASPLFSQQAAHSFAASLFDLQQGLQHRSASPAILPQSSGDADLVPPFGTIGQSAVNTGDWMLPGSSMENQLMAGGTSAFQNLLLSPDPIPMNGRHELASLMAPAAVCVSR